MGTTSYISNQNLLDAESIAGFLEANQDNMLDLTLSEYLMALLKQNNLRRSDIVRDSGLEKAYVYQIFNGEKKPSRDKLIAITFGLHLPVEETQRTLKLGGYSELYARVARDAVILFAVNHGKDIWETEGNLCGRWPVKAQQLSSIGVHLQKNLHLIILYTSSYVYSVLDLIRLIRS